MATQAKTSTSSLNDVKNDIATLRKDVASLSKSVGNDIKNNVKNNATHLREVGTEKYEQFEDKVREKPAVSLGLAFGAGLLVSALIKSRKS